MQFGKIGSDRKVICAVIIVANYQPCCAQPCWHSHDMTRAHNDVLPQILPWRASRTVSNDSRCAHVHCHMFQMLCQSHYTLMYNFLSYPCLSLPCIIQRYMVACTQWLNAWRLSRTCKIYCIKLSARAMYMHWWYYNNGTINTIIYSSHNIMDSIQFGA